MKLRGSVSTNALHGRQNVFKESFRAIIEQEVKKARYNPEEDPFLQDHKRKVKKILNKMHA
jgi:hypothetical protein